jgi:hypothetical protein
MKKKLTLKVILNVILVVCIAYLLYDAIIYVKWFISTEKYAKHLEFPSIFWYFKHETFHLLFTLFALICNIVTLILIDFKGISYLCNSALKEYREHKEVTKEEQKKKKIEALEKELHKLKMEK